MRKFLAVAVALAMILTMIIPSVAMAAVDYSYIKVQLASMGSPSSVQFKVAGAYRIAEKSDVDLFPGITYTLKVSGTTQKLTYNNGVSAVSVSLPASVTFVQYSNGSTSNFLYINNPGLGWRHYSGNMTFRTLANSSSGARYLQLINTLFIETYLYGVVAYEMGDTWPAEALKAQAVCARTYAMRFIKANQGAAYYLDDSSSYQVYGGYPFNSNGKEMSNVISAVNATRGKVIVTGNPASLADGMYSASDGGQINTASMRFKNGVDTYHVFKDDPYDLANSASPSYSYYFPKNVSSLSTADKAKANSMLALLLNKLPNALAQKGITCTKDQITINGVTSAVPTAVRNGMPAGSKMYTQIAVTVNVTVSGASTAIAAVSYNGTAIASGDASPSAAEGTDFGSANVGGAQVTRTYMIKNTGSADMQISGITMTGGNAAADFTVSSAPTTVAKGQTATFSVNFTPTAAGARNTMVSIASNDMLSPYTFQIQGTGINNQDNITSFKFQGYDGYPGVIGDSNITVDLPTGTDVTKLVAVFSTSTGATVKLGGLTGATQQSGSTQQNFTYPIVYCVIAQDTVSSKLYTVTVTTNAAQQGIAAAKTNTQPLATKSESGGGGMPAALAAGNAFDVVVNLVYLSQSSDGDWDTLGELRQKPFSDGNSLLAKTSQLWLLYQGTADSNFLYVVARGFGHGVGMSQRGAQQMAAENKSGTSVKYTYTDILDFYFNISAGKAALSTMSLTQKTLSLIPGKSSKVYGKVTSSSLNVRATTSTKGVLLATLNKDTVVELLDTTSTKGWYKILYASKGLIGYVNSTYMKKTTAPTPTPSSSTTPTPTPTPSGATPTPSPTASATPPLGRVVATSLSVRNQPNTSSSNPAIFTLHKNDVVMILDMNAATNWYKIRYGASITGYCMYQSGTSQYIEIVGTAPTATPTPSSTASGGAITLSAITATANVSSGSFLTLRKSPSTTATKLDQIPAGSSFTVLLVDTSKTWLKVKYKSTTGYVQAKYAKIAGSTANRACTVTNAQLNVRKGSGTSYEIIGTLKAGDTAVVLATVTISSTEKWYKLKIGSSVGYIDSRYARLSNNS